MISKVSFLQGKEIFDRVILETTKKCIRSFFGRNLDYAFTFYEVEGIIHSNYTTGTRYVSKALQELEDEGCICSSCITELNDNREYYYMLKG